MARGRRCKSRNVSACETSFEEQPLFARPNSISPHLICVICAEVFKKPYRAPCGHSFCYSCISEWLKNSKDCPVDRNHLTLNAMHHDFILESIIGDYTVACPWRASGCNYIGPLCQLESHKKNCVMNPDHLPEPLRIREKANARLIRSTLSATNPASGVTTLVGTSPTTTSTSAASVSPALAPPGASTRSSLTTAAESGGSGQASGFDDEDEEDEDVNLPPTPPPSLLMRLFNKADSKSRDLLCTFLGGSDSPRPSSSSSSREAKRRSRGGAAAAATGPRDAKRTRGAPAQ